MSPGEFSASPEDETGSSWDQVLTKEGRMLRAQLTLLHWLLPLIHGPDGATALGTPAADNTQVFAQGITFLMV